MSTRAPSSDAVRRLRLRQAAPLQARLTHGLVWALSGSGPWRALTLVQVPLSVSQPFDGTAQASSASDFTLATGRGPLRIATLSWLTVASGIPLDSGWPAEALADMARLAAASLPHELRAAFGNACAWHDPPVPPATGTATATFLLSLVARDGTQHSVQAGMPWPALAGWLQQPDWQSLAQPASRIHGERLTAHAGLALASLPLSCKALGQLRVGDAVRLALAPRARLTCCADLGPWRMYGGLEPGRFFFHYWERTTMSNRIEGACTDADADPDIGNLSGEGDRPGDRLDKRHDAHEDEDYGDDDGGPTGTVPPLDDLPVVVTVIAGRLRMNLQALRGLKPGDTVALGGEALPRVELRAGSHLLARGELVDLNGSLAVEITELAGQT